MKFDPARRQSALRGRVRLLRTDRVEQINGWNPEMNKLASLEATLVRNYDLPTDGGEV